MTREGFHREGEIVFLSKLLGEGVGVVPLIFGKSGVGKTALLRVLAQGEGLENTSLKTSQITLISAELFLNQKSPASGVKLYLLDNLERLNQAQAGALLSRVEAMRDEEGIKTVLAVDDQWVAHHLGYLLGLYRFVKPVRIHALSERVTVKILRESSLGASEQMASLITQIAQDFYPKQALPGAALELATYALSTSSRAKHPKKKIQKNPQPNQIAEELSTYIGVPTETLLADRITRLERMREECIGWLDQAGLSQAAEGMNEVLRRRCGGVSSGVPRRKPLASFILAGMETIRVDELSCLYAKYLWGRKEVVTYFCAARPSRREGIEVLRELDERVQRVPNSLIVVKGIESAPVDLIEQLAQILEEGVSSDEVISRTDYTRTIFIFATETGRALAENANYVPSQLHKAISKEVQSDLPAALWRRVDGIFIRDHGLSQHVIMG